MSTSVERINVNFPRPVLEDLRRLVPAKRRSEVIARATARELRRLKMAAQFETLEHHPLWTVEAYPLLGDGAAIDSFIVRLRSAGAFVESTADSATTRKKARRE